MANLNVRIDDFLLEHLKHWAKRNGYTLSEQVRFILFYGISCEYYLKGGDEYWYKKWEKVNI